MAFDSYEESAQSGAPVEFYIFRKGLDRLNFTSHDAAVTVDTVTYATAPISRSEIEETGEVAKSELTITVPHNFDAAGWFSPYPPSEVVTVEVWRYHRGDVDVDVKMFWIGRIMSVRWQGERAELVCESLVTSLKRPGLRRLYQRACPHILYGLACGVASVTFKHGCTLFAASGTTLQSADFDALADGYLAGGFIEWINGGNVERRAVRSHVGSTVVISHPIVGIESTSNVLAYAGCDHSIATCAAKFSNVANYGGFPNIPRKNPFGNNSVFY